MKYTIKNLKSKMKYKALNILHISGLSRIIGKSYQGQGVILTFHEIHNNPIENLGIGCTPDMLHYVILTLRKEGYEIVPLDIMLERLKDPNSGKIAVITFDDGYRNVHTNAFPIMQAYQVPFTIYVPTDALTRQLNAWWCALRTLFLQHVSIEIKPMNIRYNDLNNLSQKKNAFDEILAWVWQDFNRINQLLDVFKIYNIDMPIIIDNEFLSLDEYRALMKSNLMTISGHTTTHRPLNILSDGEIYKEMNDNKHALENYFQKPVDHFAYPYGRPAIQGQREATIAMDVGFKTAVTTDTGCLFASYVEEPYLLPRIHAEYPYHQRAAFNCAKLGVMRAITSHFGEPAANIDINSSKNNFPIKL